MARVLWANTQVQFIMHSTDNRAKLYIYTMTQYYIKIIYENRVLDKRIKIYII